MESEEGGEVLKEKGSTLYIEMVSREFELHT